MQYYALFLLLLFAVFVVCVPAEIVWIVRRRREWLHSNEPEFMPWLRDRYPWVVNVFVVLVWVYIVTMCQIVR